MSTKVSKAEFDALPDSLKTKFRAEGDDYELIEEDVEGLKKSKAEILQEKKELQSRLEAAEKFKNEHEAAESKAAQDLLVKQGEFEKAQETRDAEWQKRLDEVTGQKDGLFSDVHRERLTNELVKRGALADRADYLVSDLISETELFKHADSGKYDIRKKGGIGDAAEFDKILDGVKESKPFFFAANGTSGSGASGSDKNGGSSAKTWTRSQWDTASDMDRTKFSQAGGQVKD